MKSNSRGIEINDDCCIPVEMLTLSPYYEHKLESVLISNGLIQDRTEALANEIFSDNIMAGETSLVCMCVLKSAAKFFNTLTNKLTKISRNNGSESLKVFICFVKASKHKLDTSLLTSIDLSHIQGGNVLIIDTLISGGTTLRKLTELIQTFNPKAIKTCTLLAKRNEHDYTPDYVGFNVSNKILVGYGLNLNEQFNNLEHICTVKSKFSTYEQQELNNNKLNE